MSSCHCIAFFSPIITIHQPDPTHSMNNINAQATSTSSKSAIAVPDGYTLMSMDNGTDCIVPEYLVPATNDAFNGYRRRLAMEVNGKSGGVSVILTRPDVRAGQGQ